MGKLDETRNFIDLFRYHVGQSEIPSSYYLWSCLSLLAACVGDRVWITSFQNAKTLLNLYVFLIGPSGIGKDKAIHSAVSFIKDAADVGLYAGRATAPFLIDELARRSKQINAHDLQSTPFYFVTEELNYSIRSGEMAQDLISLMTELYVYKDYPLHEGTRLNYRKTIKGVCVNWLAASTPEWLTRSVPRDSIEGGFFGRVITVRAAKDYRVCYPEVLYPSDAAQVRAHLSERVSHLLNVQGELTFTAHAKRFHDQWHRHRYQYEVPDDKTLEPTFNRTDELVKKIAALLVLAEWDGTTEPPDQFHGEIDQCHLEDAIALWEKIYTDLPSLMKIASKTVHSEKLTFIAELIEKVTLIERKTLAKRAYAKGYTTKELDTALDALIDQGFIKGVASPVSEKRQAYQWVEGKD